MLQIKAVTPEIGAGTTPEGNVEIHAMDRQQGIAVTIEINSSVWKEVLSKFSRLKGVGIATPTGNVLTFPDKEG